MSFAWTQHRFAGGALALDVANSVILRFDPDRSVDRFADPAQLLAFPAAAQRFSAERALFDNLAPVEKNGHLPFLQLREAIDCYFRSRIEGRQTDFMLADLLENIATTLRRSAPKSLESATAHSAMRLLDTTSIDRLKICGHCGWLFIDRSRNRSRMWCDMAVCGNRIKAKRFYERNKPGDR
jgi:predicted RNA-binding Zn ribbon-like protein